ncbi:hypothetical protein PROFUN_09345 [Planoprotostelium fungivorum]|uniref:Uncharacterized protein n=1 Tax=Planoprotostelium fungivorum TaxID=1890364 RepID=A0A2P6NGV6_9EUKA|nr:hypothetical protein PROFUN_09345 [Planoprotostelium fungivorum]
MEHRQYLHPDSDPDRFYQLLKAKTRKEERSNPTVQNEQTLPRGTIIHVSPLDTSESCLCRIPIMDEGHMKGRSLGHKRVEHGIELANTLTHSVSKRRKITKPIESGYMVAGHGTQRNPTTPGMGYYVWKRQKDLSDVELEKFPVLFNSDADVGFLCKRYPRHNNQHQQKTAQGLLRYGHPQNHHEFVGSLPQRQKG